MPRQNTRFESQGGPLWRFWVTAVLTALGVAAAWLVATRSREIVLQLQQHSDTQLRAEIRRVSGDYAGFLTSAEARVRDSIDVAASRLSFKGMGRSSLLVETLNAISVAAVDSIELASTRCNRAIEDLLFASGYDNASIKSVGFLGSETAEIEKLATRKERIIVAIRAHVQGLIQSRGLP